MKMKRTDKAARVIRYITGITGIPAIGWAGSINEIGLPYPHEARLVTDNRHQRFFDYLKEAREDRLAVVIKYDGNTPTVERAVVGMTLRTYSELLACYYQVKGDRDAADARKR